MIFRETIVALSSGRLPAGVAIIRISGERCRFVTETVVGTLPADRMAAYRTFRDHDGAELDKGLVIFFPGPASFTGEDVAEFHVHGAKAVVSAMLRRLTALPGVRLAEPGEFTRRAFLNGRLDLVEAEALGDLITAETEAQRRFALHNAKAQSELYGGWRRRLIHARAMIEAEIDFADEDDVPGSMADTVWADVAAVQSEMSRHIERFRSAEILRDGFDVVIVGAPNAGKSSLFNALAQREVAIVSDEPGTTRDLLEVVLDLRGMRVRITDTAGLREDAGKVETIGIGKARHRAEEADLVLVLEDLNDPRPVEVGHGRPVIRIGTKADLVLGSNCSFAGYDFAISSVTGQGMSELLEEIGCSAEAAAGPAGEVLPARLRHLELLQASREMLGASLFDARKPPELRAEELRIATDRLGRITGAVDVEDLLDVIFSTFCIGK